MLPEAFAALLAELERTGIDYVVVGGVAVNLLGYERVTGDVDVLVPARPEAARQIQALLGRLGATRPDGTPLPGLLFDGEHHIRALTAHGLIDFIPEGESPLTFDEVRAGARRDELHGTAIWAAGLEHLVALKRLAGRPRDRDDLARLREAYGTLPGEQP